MTGIGAVCPIRPGIRLLARAGIGVVLVLMLASPLQLAAESPPPERIYLEDDLFVEPLTSDVGRHVTIRTLGDITFGSNGLFVRGEHGVLVIDTPWGEDETRVLLAWIVANVGPVVAIVGTHAHEDRVVGFDVAAEEGVETLTSPGTRTLSVDRGLPVAARTPTPPFRLEEFGVRGEVFYPGPGHSADNVVVWLQEPSILFGGCLVRSATAKGMGYTGDADIGAWAATVTAVLDRYPDVRVVVPGHGGPGDGALLEGTRELVTRHAASADEDR